MKKTLLFLLFPILNFGQTQVGLDINGGASGDNSGRSIAISNYGTIVAIGAPGNTSTSRGSVSVYKNTNETWAKIGSDIYGEMISDKSGTSVTLSGDGTIVAIGAPTNKGSYGSGSAPGHVRVYKNIGGTWNQVGADIDGEGFLDNSGWSISLSNDGTVLAIGAISADGSGRYAGQVKVFKNVSNAWIQFGNSLNGKTDFEYRGWSVSLSKDGNVLAIGSPKNDSNGIDCGQVSVFRNVNGAWTQMGSDINGLSPNEFSGWSIDLSNDGSVLAIGAQLSPIVRVYKNVGETWNQFGSDIYDAEVPESSGRNVSISGNGNIVAIGAPYRSGNEIVKGRVRLYKNKTGIWTKIGLDINGEADKDGSSWSISLSDDGSILAVGAPYNIGVGTDSGHVRVYNLSPLLSSNEFVLSNFTLYPNPSSKDVFIQLQENLELEKVNIYDTLGKLIKTEKNSIISVSSLSKGSYFFEVITNIGRAARIVIVK